MLMVEQVKDLQLSKYSKYLCSTKDCIEVVLQFDKNINMWVTEFTILDDYEVREFIEDECVYVTELPEF